LKKGLSIILLVVMLMSVMSPVSFASPLANIPADTLENLLLGGGLYAQERLQAGVDAVLITNVNLTMEQRMRVANDDLANRIDTSFENYFRDINMEGRALSINPYLARESYIVYGDPHGDNEDDRFRYVGHTMSDYPFTNYLFRDDATGSDPLWDRNWLHLDDPEVEARIRGQEIEWNRRADYRFSIMLGLMLSRGLDYHFPPDRLDEHDWTEIVHIYQPPTEATWGTGVLHHRLNGRIWYMTIPLLPLGFRLTELQVNMVEDHLGNHVSLEMIIPTKSGDAVVLTSTPERELIEWVD